MNKIRKIKIDDIKPADYNPRILTQNAFENLQNSIKKLGVLKPIIVHAENNTIVAGHQRTRAMKSLGIEEVDAFVISGINQQDECRFNQLHNRCEYEVGDAAPKIRINKSLKLGYNTVECNDIIIVDKGTSATLNTELAKLIARYGEFGCPICNMKGEVGISSAYALASKLIGKPLTVIAVNDIDFEIAKYYFSLDYGMFDYSGIERKTYIQSLAQINRLSKGKGKMLGSTLYDKIVIPYLRQSGIKASDLRILDFGAGKYAYANMLRKNGYKVHRVDPYHRISSAGSADNGNIDILNNTRDFLLICDALKKFGRYDIVICDSVLNSVDSMQSYYDVIYTCYGLLRAGGTMFISGRHMDDSVDKGRCKGVCLSNADIVYFPDKNGMTCNFRNGAWFFQKFCTKEQVQEWAARIDSRYIYTNRNTNSYQVQMIKRNVLDENMIIQSLRREFDMMLPNGQRYGLSDEIENAYKIALENENSRVQDK